MSTTSAPAPGRRERKKRETRKALQRTAVRLAATDGLADVTVEQIADEVDVSPRTFFNYFSSKEAAVVGDDPQRAERLRSAVAAQPVDEPPLRAVRAVMLALAEEMGDERDEALQRMALIRADPVLLAASFAAWSRVEHALTEEVAARLGLDPQDDVYPALVVAAVAGATRVAVTRWREGDDRPLPDAVAATIDALAAGLPAPGAR